MADVVTRSRKKLIMAAALSNAVYAYLFAQKRVEMEDGGPDISNPLIVGRNPNITSMQYYDSVPVNQTNEFDTVNYTLSRVVGTMIISDQEQDENTGASVIFKILKGKIQALDESIKEKFSDYVFGAGAGTDPNGLSNLIPDDPTTGTVGGINLANETQFRSSSYDFNGNLDANNIEEAFDDIALDLTRNGESPSVCFAGRNIFRLHRTAARDKMQISLGDTGTGKKLINLGIVGTTHNGKPILFDEKLNANKCYWVNEKFLMIHILKGVNMKVKKLTAPWNTDATGRRVVWEGQMCTWRQYRTHAVVINE
jgi:hypothetical protein